MKQLIKFVLFDIIRSKVIIGYTLFLLITSLSLFMLEEQHGKVMISMSNIVLIVIPLVALIYTTIHYYNSSEFIGLMLAQPISRFKIFTSEFIGVAGAFQLATFIGIGLPIMILSPERTGFSMLLISSLLSLIFCALGFQISVFSRDKARGIGIAILVWFYFSIIFDGLFLVFLFYLRDYPIEKFSIVLASFNPIDLGRIFIMLQMDISALMGLTGAIFQQFFGSTSGMFYVVIVMFIWVAIPTYFAIRKFMSMDW